MRIEITLPIKIVSELNLREHWTKKHRRHKRWHKLVWAALLQHRGKIILPCCVTLIREAPRALDADNLMGAFKSLRDYVADQIIPGLKMGQADHDERITWGYMQLKTLSKKYSCKIIIESNDE